MMVYLGAKIVNYLVKSIFILNNSLFNNAKFKYTVTSIGFSRL
jgi:hypothetical protein